MTEIIFEFPDKITKDLILNNYEHRPMNHLYFEPKENAPREFNAENLLENDAQADHQLSEQEIEKSRNTLKYSNMKDQYVLKN